MFSIRLLFLALVALVASAAMDPFAAYELDAASEVSRKTLADGKLTKIVLKEGNGSRPKAGSQITAHYDGKLAEDGKQFESSRKR
jgi:FKBP-type peptidyl-prolyl cis-trans isomerase